MQLNIRLIAYGAVAASAYRITVASLDGLSRLIVMCSLVALVASAFRRSPNP